MVEGVHARATGQGLHLRSLVSRTATLGCACYPMPPLGLYAGGLRRGAFAIFSHSSKRVCRHLGIGRMLYWTDCHNDSFNNTHSAEKWTTY